MSFLICVLITLKTIQEAESGNPMLRLFDEFSMNFALFLSQIYKKDSFDCIVPGGNISNASSLFLPQLRQHLATRSVPAAVYISTFGESAALVGAAGFIR